MEKNRQSCLKKALVIDRKMNVAVALADLNSGDECSVIEEGGCQYTITVWKQIPFGHKFALSGMGIEDHGFDHAEKNDILADLIPSYSLCPSSQLYRLTVWAS